MMQTAQFLTASSLYLTRALLARTACTANAAASAISARLEPLLDSRGLGAHYLCRRRCCSLCSVQTPRACTRSRFSWQARTVTAMLQLVQSLNVSGLHSTRVPLAGIKWAGDAAACAVSERIGSLLDPSSPDRHELCHRCCSLCSLQTPRAFTRPGFSWQA